MCVGRKMEVKMKTDKIKKSLLSCSEKKCEECLYNNWVREVCQTRLLKDAAKMIGGNNYGN